MYLTQSPVYEPKKSYNRKRKRKKEQGDKISKQIINITKGHGISQMLRQVKQDTTPSFRDNISRHCGGKKNVNQIYKFAYAASYEATSGKPIRLNK